MGREDSVFCLFFCLLLPVVVCGFDSEMTEGENRSDSEMYVDLLTFRDRYGCFRGKGYGIILFVTKLNGAACSRSHYFPFDE